MAIFNYRAKNLNAVTVNGSLEAYSREDALVKLSEQNLYAVNMEERPERASRFTVKPKLLSEFCKELSLMIYSGLPLVKALQIMSNSETTRSKMRAVLQKLHRSLRSGTTLSEAMREQGKTFPELVINMFYSGEISGTIGNVAEKMADYYLADYKLRKKISSSTLYPKILGVLSIAVIIILFAFVLPNILIMLEGQELPAITQFMKNVSDIMVSQWYVLLIIFAIITMLFIYVKEIRFIRYRWDKLLLRIPKAGRLLRTIYTARFARTLSSLYGSGIQLVTAISVSAKIIGNSYVEGQFPEIAKRLRNGESLSAVISGADGFNEKLKSLIVIGEETGRLDEILSYSSASFEYDADGAIESLLAFIQPALLVVMAVIIGTVIVSVMMPIYQMYDTVGGM